MCAPPGWHVPELDEINELLEYLGGRFVAGEALKNSGHIEWFAAFPGFSCATNESGFNALPAGQFVGDSYNHDYDWAIFLIRTKSYEFYTGNTTYFVPSKHYAYKERFMHCKYYRRFIFWK